MVWPILARYVLAAGVGSALCEHQFVRVLLGSLGLVAFAISDFKTERRPVHSARPLSPFTRSQRN